LSCHSEYTEELALFGFLALIERTNYSFDARGTLKDLLHDAGVSKEVKTSSLVTLVVMLQASMAVVLALR
jgi:hypothetical protein